MQLPARKSARRRVLGRGRAAAAAAAAAVVVVVVVVARRMSPEVRAARERRDVEDNDALQVGREWHARAVDAQLEPVGELLLRREDGLVEPVLEVVDLSRASERRRVARGAASERATRAGERRRVRASDEAVRAATRAAECCFVSVVVGGEASERRSERRCVVSCCVVLVVVVVGPPPEPRSTANGRRSLR